MVSAKETAAQFSLKATPDLAPPGSGVPITVTWRAPNGRPKNDWVALFAIKGNNHQRIGPWTQTDGKTSGSFKVPAPTGEGIYEFRYLLNSGHTDITRSSPITIDAAKTAAGFRLRANPDRAPPGGALPITVEWQAPEGRPKNDWVALFRIGGNNHQRIGPWTHTEGKAKGTFEVPSPAGDGLYEFRYLLSGGHTDIARTDPVIVSRSVTDKPFTVTIEPAGAEPGAKLTIAWTAPEGRPKNDWIAFFLQGSNNHQRIGRWVHTEGKAKGSFETVAPGGIGTYEARYMTSGGHTDMAQSKPVVINHADAAYRLAMAASVAPGKPMKVQWQAPAGRPANDWIALFSVEGNNHQRVGAWISTEGQRSGGFDRTAPTKPGLYEFRYLLAGGHADVTRSAAIRVGEAKGKAPPPAPKVHTVTADDGRAPRAGTTIIIKGQGFAPSPGGNRVFFGKGAGIQPTRASATELQVTVPAQAKRLDVAVGRTGAKTRSVPYQTIFAPQATAKVAGTAQADLKRLQAALGDQTPLAAAATEGGSRIGGALQQAASVIGAAHQAIGRPDPETRARIADTWQAMGLPALIKDVEAAIKAARAKAVDSMDAALSARSAAAGAGAAAQAMGEGFARACRAVASAACDAIERAAQTVAGTADRVATWVGPGGADPTRTAGQQPTGGQTGGQGAGGGSSIGGGQSGGGGAGRDIPPPDEAKPEDKPENKKPEEEKPPGRSVDELESGGWVVFLAKSIGAFIENTETYADRKSCTLAYGGLCSKDSPTLKKFSPRVLYGPFPDRYGAEVAYCDNLDKDSVRYVLGVVWGTIGGIRTAVGNRPSCPPTKPTPTRTVDPRKADVDLNLVMAGVSNDEEERLGGYVRLNRDDDNGNKTPDLKDSGPINGEDDLLGIELRTRRSRQDIPITLAATKGGSRIRVWTGPRRTNEIKLPFTWKGEEPSKLPGGSSGAIVPIPVKLFVEGVRTSAGIADVGLRLYASGNRGWLTDKSEAEDRVSLTVFDVDLGMPGLPPDQENDLLLGLNDDDDDRDVKEDRNNGGRPIRGEDDLYQIAVTVTPPLPPRAATVALEVGAGLKLWEDAGASKIAVDAGRGAVRKPLPTAEHGKKSYFVEGYGLASRPAEIAVEVDVRGAGTIGKITEKLLLTVARADISIDGFTDEGEKEFFEGGLVAKARLPAPDPSEMTVLNLSV
ncbi:MAG: IPT/TIG domain-containing protein, partial [Alphaproteobacteria bacterium]